MLMRTTAIYNRDALRTIYAACLQVPCLSERLAGCDFELFKEAAKDFVVLGLYRGNECIGGAIWKDGSGHIAVLDEHRRHWCNKETLTEVVNLWRRDGPMVNTSIHERNFAGIRFVEKLGLRPSRKTGHMIEYEGTL